MPEIERRRAEWLEADGLGGFASGTVDGVRTRRYHALLLAATTPPTGRFVLVNGFDAWVETPAGRFSIASQSYAPGIVTDGAQRLVRFEAEPWPRWRIQLEDGTRIEHEIVARRGVPVVALSWRLVNDKNSAPPTAGVRRSVSLCVRPFLSGRDYHSTHHENGAFRFEPHIEHQVLRWRPYDGIPEIVALSNGTYTYEPQSEAWWNPTSACSAASCRTPA